ncbi:MAG TPA: hypothetical protein VMK65_12170, partial [Longimicrobiales bacterium]|nr:hypothetical protein [Longimicrobiales bacterium]
MRPISLRPLGTRVAVAFAYDPELIEAVRRVPGRRWEAAARAWTVPRAGHVLDEVVGACGAVGDVVFDVDPALLALLSVPLPRPVAPPADASGATQDALDQVRSRMVREGYSPRTRKNYLGHIRRFLAAVDADP